jgi:hypothetical protein
VLKISVPLGFKPWTVQLIASHYTDWAILVHIWWEVLTTLSSEKWRGVGGCHTITSKLKVFCVYIFLKIEYCGGGGGDF